jgi:hypothetical protein
MIGDLLQMSPDAIYERQRALAKAGLLEETQGRGPGSGVRATPETMATLLITLLAADELNDVSTHVKRILNLKSKGGRTFLQAVTERLSDPATCKDLLQIDVSRTAQSAFIHHEDDDRNWGAGDRWAGKAFLQVEASMKGPVFRECAKALENDRKYDEASLEERDTSLSDENFLAGASKHKRKHETPSKGDPEQQPFKEQITRHEKADGSIVETTRIYRKRGAPPDETVVVIRGPRKGAAQ